ncbi:MAG: hypothetical protein HOE76_06610 [Euryarchaeota archaeon]|jgi:hypothetical protein|nr:hypothetical protein [Euryarchaeota archaeon]MBT4982623.1 hypothetical protein [Euryarchaeota archaeon]MBT5183934.1 hypothetical protein [Euryarchaeota archaeon]
MREWILIALMLSLSFVGQVSAEEEEGDPFIAAGLNLVALRNDSLDSNQDSIMDAVRVVVVINSTDQWMDLTLTLIGEHSGFTVSDEKFMSFEGQENASLTYDSWAEGEHRLTLEISDIDGRLLKSINIGTFDLSPALATPSIDLVLSGSEIMQTGDACEITRNFVDETGPRWNYDGTRSIIGTPFKALDTDVELDCSIWPAGTYIVSETYQNGLGQTTTDSLELVIVNKPPSHFTIEINGDEELVGTPCTITHLQAVGENHDDYQKTWTVTPSIGMTSNASVLDCSKWSSGVYKILLTVTNDEEIRTTGGTMLIRMPSPSKVKDVDAPVLSEGSETETSTVGLWGIGVLALVLGLAVFVLMMRGPEDEHMGSSMLDEIGEPDAEGLPTHLDENGMLWRRHDDGEVDWWDRSSLNWKRW